MKKSRHELMADEGINNPQFLAPATKNMFDQVDDIDEDRTVYDDADDHPRKAA